MHDKYYDLDTLDSLTRVEGVLVNETPIRVGSGRGETLDAAADLNVYRVGKEPCIPGSSLKGVFRSYLERLEATDGSPVHDPWDLKIQEEEEKTEICPLCGIFGSIRLASHVRIYDAYVIGNYSFLIKRGVSIDREFGAQRPGLLYSEELVSPGCNWRFKMDILNIRFPPLDEEGRRTRLLLRLFEALKNDGLQVGARESVGSGIIRLKDATWRRYEIVDGRLKRMGEGYL